MSFSSSFFTSEEGEVGGDVEEEKLELLESEREKEFAGTGLGE